jgi:hypothetical protein
MPRIVQADPRARGQRPLSFADWTNLVILIVSTVLQGIRLTDPMPVPLSSTRDVSTFQGLILALQEYWAAQGCVLLQPYDMEVLG